MFGPNSSSVAEAHRRRGPISGDAMTRVVAATTGSCTKGAGASSALAAGAGAAAAASCTAASSGALGACTGLSVLPLGRRAFSAAMGSASTAASGKPSASSVSCSGRAAESDLFRAVYTPGTLACTSGDLTQVFAATMEGLSAAMTCGLDEGTDALRM